MDKQILLENIPQDLLKAYKSTYDQHSTVGNAAYPHLFHSELDNVSDRGTRGRRFANFDYGKASYEPISSDEAIQYLSLEERPDGTYKCTNKNTFGDHIKNLRILVPGSGGDSNLVEFELKPNGSIYYTYWAFIPWNILDREHFSFRGKNGQTNDTKFANTYTDIANILSVANKIYKTDEYDHLIHPNDKATTRVISQSPTPKGSEIYDAHYPDNNIKTGKYVISTDILDTGDHRDPIQRIRSRINNHTGDESLSDDIENYFAKKYLKEVLYNQIDGYNGALKALERNKDDYTQEEYQAKKDHYTLRRQKLFKQYNEVCVELRDLKNKILVVDHTGQYLKARQKVLDFAVKLSDLRRNVYNTKKLLDAESTKVLATDPDILYDFKQLLDELDTLEEEHKKLTDTVETDPDETLSDQEKAKIEKSLDTSEEAESIIKEIETTLARRDAEGEKAFTNFLSSLETLEMRFNELKAKLDEVTPKTAEKERISKERSLQQAQSKWNDQLAQIIQFEKTTKDET